MSAEESKVPAEENKHDVDYADPEKDAEIKAGGLADVKVVKGTEGETCIWKCKIKLFRFNDSQWKERGVGFGKLMRNDELKRVRMVARQDKTLKPIANFIIQDAPCCELKPMPNAADKAYSWACNDASDGETKLDQLAARFRSVEDANLFKSVLAAA